MYISSSQSLRLVLVAALFLTLPLPSLNAQIIAGANDFRERGIALINKGQFDEALLLLKQATKSKSDDAETWYFLGIAYVQTEDFQKATSAFSSATKLSPTYLAAHTGLSYALLRRGKLHDAEVAAARALEIDPKNVDANYTMGVIKLKTGLRDEALSYADRTIELNPGFADGYLLRSQALVYFSGDIIVKDKTETSDKTFLRYKAAAESLEKFLELRGDNSVVDVWKEQLKSLKFYLSSSDKSRPVEVYVGRAVTTKARLMSKPIPEYPSQARNGGVSGTVVLKAVFAADGQVKHIIVVQSLPGGLTEASINAAKKIKFVPATLDGKPVSMWMQLEYNFGYR